MGNKIYKSRGFALLAAFFLLAYPFAEARMLALETTAIRSVRLPLALDGLRVAFVSDLHWGNGLSDRQLEALCAAINALDADIVLLGGDYAENSAGAIALFERLPPLDARLAVAAAMGNHDRTPPESNLERLEAAMRATGVTPLTNASLTIAKGLTVCAVDDVHTGHPEFAGLAARTNPEDYVIFLCHSPAGLPKALALDFFDLALCGHTHGSLLVPWLAQQRVPRAFAAGWAQAGRADVLTSNGVGSPGLGARVAATPQLHLIVLRHASGP